jgi:hypothetical protein
VTGINISGVAVAGLTSPPYVVWQDDFAYNIWRVLNGTPTNLTNDDPVAGERAKHNPIVSPDETMIAYCEDVQDPDFSALYVMDADGSNRVQIDVVTDEYVLHPYWRPDSGKLVYTVGIDSDFAGAIYEINPDGTGKTLLASPPGGSGAVSDLLWRPQYNRDGTKLVWGRILSTPNSYELWQADADGSNAAKVEDMSVIHQAGSQFAYAWTSDRIAYLDSSGGEAYTIDPDGTDQAQISDTGEAQAVTKSAWATDDSLVYGVADGDVSGIKPASFDPAGGPTQTILNENHGPDNSATDRKGIYLYRGRLWFLETISNPRPNAVVSILPNGTGYTVSHDVVATALADGFRQGQGFEYL